QGEVDLFGRSARMRLAWRQTLLEAIRRGWRITHLIRQTPDVDRSLYIAEGLIDMLGAPDKLYSPHYVSASLPNAASSDLIIVPGKAAIEMTRSQGGRYVDGAL